MSDSTDEVWAYTVRLELVDEPGEFLRALEPIAENGGNLLSIFHERGNVTPRGHIPVDTDLSDTLSRVHETTQAAVTDLSLSAPEGTEDESSARLRLATEENERRATLAAVREIADEKGLRVIEPLAGGDQ